MLTKVPFRSRMTLVQILLDASRALARLLRETQGEEAQGAGIGFTEDMAEGAMRALDFYQKLCVLPRTLSPSLKSVAEFHHAEGGDGDGCRYVDSATLVT